MKSYNSLFTLFAFNDNLLAQNHSNKFECVLAVVYSCCMSECDVYKVVSSAKDKMFPVHELYISWT